MQKGLSSFLQRLVSHFDFRNKPSHFQFYFRSGTFFQQMPVFQRNSLISQRSYSEQRKRKERMICTDSPSVPKTFLLPPASVVTSFSVYGFETGLAGSQLFLRWVLCIQSEHQLHAVRHGGAHSGISSNKLVKINSVTFKICIWNVLPANAYSCLKCKYFPFRHILWMFALSICCASYGM